MLATRHIFTGAFPDMPAAARVSSLGTSGYWNDVSEPRAVYANGKTHIVFIREDGNVYAATFDHAAGTLSTPVLVFSGDTSVSGNIHHSIAVCRRASDGRVVIAYCKEGHVHVKFRVSTDPDDTSAWGSVITTSGSASYTYITLYQLDGGDLYCFTKLTTGWVLGYFKSTDGGATWGSFVPLLDSSGKSIYWRAGSNGSRIDLFPTDTDRSDGDPSSVYHFYLDSSENLRTTDGTLVGAASGGPYEVSTGTLVKDASGGPVRSQGWAYDDDGYPACLLFTYASSSNVVHVARWNGTTWGLTEVVDVGGVIASNRYVSSGAMVKTDPDVLFIPKKVGSYFELYRYQRIRGVWEGQALTSGSGADYATPDTPLDAATALQCVLGYGVFTDGTDFDFTLYRYGT